MKICNKLGWFFFSFSSIVYADWNDHFDQQTEKVVQALPPLQEEKYLFPYQIFLQTREQLLNNRSFKKKMAQTSLDEKLTLLMDPMIVKKRRNDHIHELFAWEFSCLIGASAYMIPSFPIEMEGKKAILQSRSRFIFGKGKTDLPPSVALRKVSLEGYWKAHLCAYLLGIGDLVAKNIGINEKGDICFFDAEVSFVYQNIPHRSGVSFSTGFIAHSFEWPQYFGKLITQDVQSLQEFVAELAHLEELLRTYEELRGFPILSEHFMYRLEKIRNFPIKEGVTFQDFFGFIYPRLGAGLNSLTSIVNGILKKKVGPGTTLMTACRLLHRYDLTSEQKRALEKWMKTYID